MPSANKKKESARNASERASGDEEVDSTKQRHGRAADGDRCHRSAGFHGADLDDCLGSTDIARPAASWQTLIPEIIHHRHLKCVEQTADSAREMREVVGHFVDGKGIPYEVEDTLFDAFEEDDYGGALHLSTVHIDDGKQTPIGLVFWREMPEEEMREWIDYAELVELARRRRHLQSIAADDSDGSNKPLLLNNNVDESKDSITSRDGVEIVGGDVSKQTVQQRKQEDFPTSDKLRRSLAMVQSESLKWLGQLEREEQRNQSSVVTPDDIPRDYAQAWAKIELLAVRPPWWGQKIGTLLLACAMYHAWLHNDKRCVLHVAGGTSNVPAVRLYHRFGFVPVPSGLFRKPDKDVYVLGNIDLALKSLLWSETLGLPEKGDIHSLAN